MRHLGIHSFVWTDGRTQEGLETALEKSAEHGYRMVELAYLFPGRYDLDRIATRARALDLDIVVTMGLPADCDVSSEDGDIVARGRSLLSDVVHAVRDVGGIRLGGILYSKHGKYDRMPSRDGWMNSAEAIAAAAGVAKESGVEIVLEIVNRFESNLLNTTAQGLRFIADTGRNDVFLHLDTFHMNIEEADPAAAIRLAGDKLGYFHIGESYRGFLGTGTVDFAASFRALADIGFSRDITFESFSGAIVDEALSVACGIWRDTWTDSDALAAHARTFIEEHWREAAITRQINAAG